VGTTEDTPTLVRRADGETITEREGRQLIVLAERGPITITWSRHAPGEPGPDLHVHRRHTDAFYVLQGELTFPLGPRAERLRLRAGGFVAVPPNVVHSFANEGSADARWLNLHAADTGFAAYMRALRDGTEAAFDSYDPPADGGLPATEAIVSGPGKGERLVTGSRTAFLKGALPDLCFVEWALDGPFDGPDLHHHDRQVDAYYVLEGELDLTVDRTVHAVGADTLAPVPRGVGHTFAHTRPGTARVLNVHAPDGGFADFLRRASG
jgi:mannose-6-phosphate isomerase-like protein (cupin superfamily)